MPPVPDPFLELLASPGDRKSTTPQLRAEAAPDAVWMSGAQVDRERQVPMKTPRIVGIAVLMIGGSLALHAAHTHGAPRRETVTVAADEPIPNLPGKRLVSHIVDYAPGASSASHRHARSAFIYAYVLSGEIRSQVDDEPARVYQTGEAWFERPGAHHRVSANASNIEPARLLAVLILDATDAQLVIPDHVEVSK
jgi:quercetin dioxygenase-like cupin family protein